MYAGSERVMTRNDRWLTRKPRKTMRQHDCQVCTAGGTIQVFDYYGRGDIVICQKCGAGYQIKSRRPFRMTLIESDD